MGAHLSGNFGSCGCDTPKVMPDPGERVDINLRDDRSNMESAWVVPCNTCSRLWLRCYIEDSWVSKSGRWYRVEVDEIPAPGDIRAVIEAAPYCYAGGSYHRPGAKGPLYLSNGTQRRVEGFRWDRPIEVR